MLSYRKYGNMALARTHDLMATNRPNIDLDWTKCEAGYKLDHELVQEPRPKKSRWGPPDPRYKVDGIHTASKTIIKCRPFDGDTGLYVVFANYPPTPDGIRKFCNEFGLLEHKQENGGWISKDVNDDLRQQARMKRALMLRDCDDLAGATAIINSARPSLLPRLWIDSEGAMRMSLQPPTLVAGMWLQFALDLAGGATIKRCGREGCSKPVIAGPGTDRRSSLKYCSQQCRDAAHYAEKKKKRQVDAARHRIVKISRRRRKKRTGA
jgi:hypothetical protein